MANPKFRAPPMRLSRPIPNASVDWGEKHVFCVANSVCHSDPFCHSIDREQCAPASSERPIHSVSHLVGFRFLNANIQHPPVHLGETPHAFVLKAPVQILAAGRGIPLHRKSPISAHPYHLRPPHGFCHPHWHICDEWYFTSNPMILRDSLHQRSSSKCFDGKIFETMRNTRKPNGPSAEYSARKGLYEGPSRSTFKKSTKGTSHPSTPGSSQYDSCRASRNSTP